MHRTPLLAAFILACTLSAAEDTAALALWAFGDGTVDGAQARPGQTILAGQELHAAADRPLRVLLNDAPGSTVIIGAGSTVRFLVVDLGADKGRDLVLDVNEGVVQVDLASRGPWRELRVHGGAMDVHVLGTMFMFERVKRDQDYLAMVRGTVRVNLLAAIAKALGKDPSLDIEGQRGIGAGPDGFGSIDGLNGRPQIAAAAAARLGLQSQGLTGTGGWDMDAALALTGGLGAMDQPVLPGATPGGVPAIGTAVVLDPITHAVADSINQAVVESVVQQTVQQVIDTVSASQAALPALPGPPNPPQ